MPEQPDGLKQPAPPYISLRSFKAALAQLKESGVLPGMIDRSLWRNQSGTNQSQILAGMAFFGFVDERSAPTPELRTALDVLDTPGWRAHAEALLQKHFGELLVFSKTATPRQVAEWFSRYEYSGDTSRKCAAFVVALAREAEAEVPKYLADVASRGVAREKRKGAVRHAPAPPSSPAPPPDSASSTLDSHRFTLDLRTGGSLELILRANVMTAGKEEFELISKLRDLMEAYRSAGVAKGVPS